jgi:hypothetical protein
MSAYSSDRTIGYPIRARHAEHVVAEIGEEGVVNLAARGMLVVSVARRLGSEGPLPAYYVAPL